MHNQASKNQLLAQENRIKLLNQAPDIGDIKPLKMNIFNYETVSDVYLVNPITLTNQQRLDLDLSGLSNHFDKAVETSSTKGTSGKLQSSISDSLPKHTSNISQSAKKNQI